MPDPRLRDLYAAHPSEFIAARNALSRALSEEGSGEAARVKQLRRPTMTSWLLNAVARERPDAVEELFSAGDRLRQAQLRALRGDAAELREATAELHGALQTLVSAARELSGARLGREAAAATLAELEGGLRAVATSDITARAPLRHGVLDHVPEPGGIELLSGLAAVPAPPPSRLRALEDEPRPARKREAARGPKAERKPEPVREPATDVRAARAEERARKAAEKAAEKAQRAAAERRERERRHALAEAERLDRVLRGAETRLRAAERELGDAQRRAEAARRDVEKAQRAAAAARERADREGA